MENYIGNYNMNVCSMEVPNDRAPPINGFAKPPA